MAAGKKNSAAGASCDWRQPPKSDRRTEARQSAVYRHKGACCWGGVGTERYKKSGGGWSDIVRKVLVGGKGESTKFHVRYFEIAPGGFSSLERHRHEHVVIAVRGEGIVQLGRRKRTLRYLDVAYVGPDDVHQLSNPFDEPFGFLCIVDAKRDKPKKVK